MSNLFLGLVHYPVYNKREEIIATSITNLDIHDISRVSCTFDLEKYYLIHPSEKQSEIVNEILDYWKNGYGNIYNPDRKEALDRVFLLNSIAEVVEDIEKEYKKEVKIIITDAKEHENTISYPKMRKKLEEGKYSYLILFGTGWGLSEAIMKESDYILPPIKGSSSYNHLSVRSAVSIILDRLCAEKWW